MRRRNKRRWPVRILCILLVLALILAGGYAYLLVRYPLEYEDMIRTYAAEFDLEPAFVAAVIWAESSFRAEIQSGAGAVGLMQIMPETGAWIAGKTGTGRVFSATADRPVDQYPYGVLVSGVSGETL